MDSFLQNVGGSPRVTFTVDGVATDPTGNNVTVTIRNPDGTALVTDQSATRIAAGVYGYTIDGADAGDLGIDTAEWTGDLQGSAKTLKTRFEIVGGFYFTTAEFKAAYADDDQVQALSTSQIQKARQTAEEIIERACNIAFVPRAKRLTFSGDGRTRLGIPLYKLRRVSAYSIDDVAGDLSVLSLEASSVYRSCWTRGFSNIALTVEHGYDEPPAEIRDAAILLTYHRAIKGPIEDRATGIANPDGNITLATPGLRGSVTGLPGVDAAIQQYALPQIRPMSVSLADRGNLYPPLPVW